MLTKKIIEKHPIKTQFFYELNTQKIPIAVAERTTMMGGYAGYQKHDNVQWNEESLKKIFNVPNITICNASGRVNPLNVESTAKCNFWNDPTIEKELTTKFIVHNFNQYASFIQSPIRIQLKPK